MLADFRSRIRRFGEHPYMARAIIFSVLDIGLILQLGLVSAIA